MVNSLDNILQGNEESIEETSEIVEEVVTEEPKTEVKEEVVSKEVVDETDKEDNSHEVGIRNAMLAERRKRQELEKELESLRNQTPKEKIDLFADPEAYQRDIDEKLSQTKLELKVSLSEELIQQQHQDYHELVYGKMVDGEIIDSDFAQKVKTSPALFNEIISSNNPAQTAYKMAKEMELIRGVGDIESFKDKIRREIMEEISQNKEKEVESVKEETPVTLTGMQSKSSKPTETELFKTLDQITKGK